MLRNSFMISPLVSRILEHGGIMAGNYIIAKLITLILK